MKNMKNKQKVIKWIFKNEIDNNKIHTHMKEM